MSLTKNSVVILVSLLGSVSHLENLFSKWSSAPLTVVSVRRRRRLVSPFHSNLAASLSFAEKEEEEVRF